METVYRDYQTKDVKFYYIYKSLAHPETNGYITPYSLQDRLLHVKEAERRLGSTIPWICDTMENDLKHTLGDAPNSEYIIDPKGVIVRKRRWSNPQQLRKDLEELVGPVEKITTIADLTLKTIPPPKVAPTGIVPRIPLPGPMQAIRVIPGESKTPFYVKLRAEASPQLLSRGEGSLYLAFHMDPIYKVHWNNLATPPTFTITAHDGLKVTPSEGKGPKVKEEADIDPREFLINVQQNDPKANRFTLEIRYFACNDEKGWCKPVTQKYEVVLVPDRDGGRRFAAGGRRPNPGNRPVPGNPAQILARLKSFDKNKDGKLTRAELPPPLANRTFQRLDQNNDDVIDAQELKVLERRIPQPIN